MKISSLQNRVNNKFMPKKFYEIDPRVEVPDSDTHTSLQCCITNYKSKKFYSADPTC